MDLHLFRLTPGVQGIPGRVRYTILKIEKIIQSLQVYRRAPWSVIAIAGPVSIWAAIVSVKGIEFYYAGLFTPIWIASGLNILAVYDSKNRTKFRKQMKKDKIDLESGPRHVTGSESTSAICGPLRAAQALSMTIVDSR